MVTKTAKTSSKPKATRKAKTAAELLAELNKKKADVAALELRVYAEAIDEHVKSSNVVAEFAKIKEKVKDATDVAILAAIGKAAGIERLVVSQAPKKTRAKKATV